MRLARPLASAICTYALLLLACNADESLTSSSGPTAPRFFISDGVHSGGTHGFYFLPPMVPKPDTSGPFDDGVYPTVVIQNHNNTGIARFTRSSKPAITLNLKVPQYQVTWNTKGLALGTYQITVFAGDPNFSRFLGAADVKLTATSAEAKAATTDQQIGLKVGSPLPISFRIETRIAGSVMVSPASATINVGAEQVLTATVRDLHGVLLAGKTVRWSYNDLPPGVVVGLTPISGPTDASGQAMTTVTAGTTPGTEGVFAFTDDLIGGVAYLTVVGVGLRSVSAGNSHSCGVTSSGVAYCWGSNDHGQLGDNTNIDRRAPVAVLGGLTFTSVSAGLYHSCGVTTAGAAYCWGENDVGALGNNTTTYSSVPVAVSGGLTFASVSAGFSHTCGVTTAGAAYCWGFGAFGQLGAGNNSSSTVPVLVSGSLTFASVTTNRYHSCGLTTSGVGYCWGLNSDGQLGNSNTTTNAFAPVPVSGGLTFASVRTGDAHTCGTTTAGSPEAGSAYCWGADNFGQLGNGITTDNGVATPEPVEVVGGLTFASISAGASHSCGVTTAGAAYCWGSGGSGQLGNATFTFTQNSPVAVSGGYSFASLSAGGNHVCGVTTAGATYCWGSNLNGQLGDGTFSSNSNQPVAVIFP